MRRRKTSLTGARRGSDAVYERSGSRVTCGQGSGLVVHVPVTRQTKGMCLVFYVQSRRPSKHRVVHTLKVYTGNIFTQMVRNFYYRAGGQRIYIKYILNIYIYILIDIHSFNLP